MDQGLGMKHQDGQQRGGRQKRAGKPGFVRIIGGEWRGRRLPVLDLPGLRPSGDRTRETLFNWLQPSIRGAHCADLFAGTGALGLEAASRGAAEVILVESSPPALQALRGALAGLGGAAGERVRLEQTDALLWLATQAPHSLDLVFIDPPFDSGLDTQALESLTRHDLLRPGGLVYVEAARGAPPQQPGPGWELVREKVLGEVRMALLKNLGG
jgi:16S rRNA (guanine966-N2)-methyltransferase